MSSRAWSAFAAVSVLWGIPYLFIKIAVDHGVSPAFLAWSRVTLAAVVLLALAARGGHLRTVRAVLPWLAAYAVVEIAIPFPLIAFGEQRVSSSLTAITIAAVPLIVALLALRFDHEERASGRRLVGLLVGLAGVVALVGIDAAGSGRALLGAGAVLVAAVGYAVGPMMLKRKFAHVDPRAAMGVSLAMAAVVLAPVAAIAPPSRTPDLGAVGSLVALGLLCTAAAFAVMAWLVADIGPGRALVITYINPVVALALGVALLNEHVGPGAVVGLILILAGSWLATRAAKPAGLVEAATRRPGWRRRRAEDPAC